MLGGGGEEINWRQNKHNKAIYEIIKQTTGAHKKNPFMS